MCTSPVVLCLEGFGSLVSSIASESYTLSTSSWSSQSPEGRGLMKTFLLGLSVCTYLTVGLSICFYLLQEEASLMMAEKGTDL